MTPTRIVSILTFLMLINTVALWAKDGELSSAQGIERYKKLVQTYPEEAPYWNALGYYYLKSGDFQEAEAHLAKAIELDGTYPIPHNNLGVVYTKRGRLSEAISQYMKVLEINPNHAGAHHNLAISYYSKGNYKLALFHCDKAVELGGRVNPKLLELLKFHR